MTKPSQRDFLRYALRDNTSAVLFCEIIINISQTLDDLIDKDQPLSDDDIFQSYWEALIEIPANQFYRAHDLTLRPLMAAALQDWKDSVTLERDGTHHSKTLAFVLRDQLTGLITQCAYLAGGYEWMQSVSMEVRHYFQPESFETYMDALERSHHERKKQVI